MAVTPSPTMYHRLVGWHAPPMRRVLVAAVVGLLACLVLVGFAGWVLAALGGWDVAALTFLVSVWPIILRASSQHVASIARREDATRSLATVLIVGASVASLVGVGSALRLAREASGTRQFVLVGVGVLTVMLSWTVLNTVFTLRYTHLHYVTSSPGIVFGDDETTKAPTYRDIAYVAFTIGMTYQVSDTTLRDPRIRGNVLVHAFLSYVFGVVIVAGAINLIAGLVR